VGIGYDYDSARLTLVGQTGWQTNNTLLGYIAQNLTADTWYRIKFQAIGTTLSDKAWQDGTMEPGWQLTLTDSTYASGTEITLFGGWDSPKHSEFDWVKVRSAVDPEPTVAPGTEQVATVGVVIGGDQTARVYSVDASTGGTNWTVNLTGSGAETIQAPVAAQLLAYSDATFKSTYSDDVLFVATRNSSTTNNKLFALRASDGAVLWSFNGTIGSYNVDYIVGMPWVDYARNRVYVVSRAGGGAQSSLWVINSLTGALVQSFALGHISASPTMSYDGATLYVGNEAGTLYAINLNTLAQKWSLAVGGALKGFVWEDWTTAGRLYFATGANQVRCVLDQTTSGSIQWTTAVTAPSTPLTMDTVLYVGSSDGKVHQLLLSNGTDQKQYTVGGGAYQVGDVSTETWNEIFVPTTEGKLYKLTLPLP
jgi:outer membrane protein assembly factor BamB